MEILYSNDLTIAILECLDPFKPEMASLKFLKGRSAPNLECHSVSFNDFSGASWWLVLTARYYSGLGWYCGCIGGGGTTPMRDIFRQGEWAAFARGDEAVWGGWVFDANGPVHSVRLVRGDEVLDEDTVQNGSVLLIIPEGKLAQFESPSAAEFYDKAGRLLHSQTTPFASIQESLRSLPTRWSGLGQQPKMATRIPYESGVEFQELAGRLMYRHGSWHDEPQAAILDGIKSHAFGARLPGGSIEPDLRTLKVLKTRTDTNLLCQVVTFSDVTGRAWDYMFCTSYFKGRGWLTAGGGTGGTAENLRDRFNGRPWVSTGGSSRVQVGWLFDPAGVVSRVRLFQNEQPLAEDTTENGVIVAFIPEGMLDVLEFPNAAELYDAAGALLHRHTLR